MMRISAALLVSYTLAADSCTANDIAGLNNCYQAFVGAYGFSMSNVLPHYWDMHQVRTGWLDAQGVKVQPKICQIGNNLVNCIAKFPCLSQDTFLTMGADSTESPRWFLDKIATKYQCGEGYQVLLQDYYCMAACREHRDDALSACSTMMQNEIAQGTDPCV
ncbi:unnamed protein product, partial [Mesorhabditis belari]|uniref:Secreted protein n=1 Tax=Mesorhabditis belari TaxID=2138241 RepID=A0AAF3ED72_9BILA